MPNILADRVLESSVSAGTGVFTLAGAVLGFRAFSAVCAVTDTMPYYIEGVDAQGRPTGEWEYGLGTYSAANQLTRTTIRGSSNAGLAVAFSAGTKLVGLGIAAPNSSATRAEWRTALGFGAGGDAVVPVGNGGTGQTTALAAFNALKQQATETYPGTVELAVPSEILAGTDNTRAASASAVFLTAFGLGQTWQNVTASRSAGVTYTNSTGKPIQASVRGNATLASTSVQLLVDGQVVSAFVEAAANGTAFTVSAVIPHLSNYQVIATNFGVTAWLELRA